MGPFNTPWLTFFAWVVIAASEAFQGLDAEGEFAERQ